MNEESVGVFGAYTPLIVFVGKILKNLVRLFLSVFCKKIHVDIESPVVRWSPASVSARQPGEARARVSQSRDPGTE